MRHFFKKYIFEISLCFIVFLLFLANYKPGTYLTGWDNLQTELNPILGIKRALFSVWQEYQSFGLLAGMGHAADLIRAIYVWILTFILPQNMVRYVFQFSMLLIGALGMYRLLQFTLQKPENQMFQKTENRLSENQTSDFRLQSSGFRNIRIFPFFGSLFYLLNLGTIQIMGLPFESFSVFYASLPWCVWIFIKLIAVRTEQCSIPTNKHYLLLFFLINLLATPLAVSQQLFVVYIMVLGVISLSQIFQKTENRLSDHQKSENLKIRQSVFGLLYSVIRNIWTTNNISKKNLKIIIFLLFLIFSINSFWLLPQLYFLKTSGHVVEESKINQLATDDIWYSNLEKGNIKDFLMLKGFFFDRVGIKNIYLFQNWIIHFQKPFVKMIVLIVSVIPLIGLFYKSRYRAPFLLLYLLMMIALLINTFPFNLINDIFRSNDFINQIFRNPFTKFIIPYSLVASYFFASGLIVINNLLTKVWINLLSFRTKRSEVRNLVKRKDANARFLAYARNDNKKYIFYLIIFILLILYSLPAFQGHFISSEMKVKIPARYFELMDYFKSVDKNSRIGLLPEYTFWGWYFNRWGYDGSGFLWYGIEQPIISRTFDVWNEKSESYLWEIKLASEAEDVKRFEKVLEKYNIDYLILDYSLLPVSSTLKGMQYDRIEKLLKKSPKVSLIANWKDLDLYKVKHDKTINDFITVSSNLPNIGPEIKLTNDDMAYLEYGDYMTNNKSYDIYYPFLDLTTQTRLKDKTWKIKEDEDNFYLTGRLQNNKLFTIPFAKKTYDNFEFNKTKVINCSYVKDINTEIKKNSLLLSAKNGASGCIDFNNANLEQKLGYLIKIQDQKQKGRPLFFYILDQTKKQAFIEDRLKEDTEYYLLPPRYNQGIGYYFSFQNNSYTNQTSINKLNDLSIYSFPYEQIKNIKFAKDDHKAPKAQFASDFKVNKLNYFLYEVSLPTNQLQPTNYNLQTLILYQSFHPGWEAYSLPTTHYSLLSSYFPYFFGDKIESHFPINNWANGWSIPSDLLTTNYKLQTVVILFWPQYLQFIGFIILTATFIYILVKPFDKSLIKN